MPKGSLNSNAAAAYEKVSGLVRVADRPTEVVAFEESVVTFFVHAADMLGVPKSVAAIYGICFASADPLGFSEIQDRLKISSGSISQGLRVLREVGALKTAGHSSKDQSLAAKDQAETTTTSADQPSIDAASRQARLARYEPDLELRKLVMHWIEKRLQAQLKSGTQSLTSMRAAVPSTTPKAAQVLRDRLGALQAWHDKASTLVPLAKTALKLT